MVTNSGDVEKRAGRPLAGSCAGVRRAGLLQRGMLPEHGIRTIDRRVDRIAPVAA